MRSRPRRRARSLARRAAPRLRAAARDRSRARVWRAAADRAAGPARSSSRAHLARRAGRRTHTRKRRCRPRRRCSCVNQNAVDSASASVRTPIGARKTRRPWRRCRQRRSGGWRSSVASVSSATTACIVREPCVHGGSDYSERCPRHESNMRTRFRKPLLYPLSYGGSGPSTVTLRSARPKRRSPAASRWAPPRF